MNALSSWFAWLDGWFWMRVFGHYHQIFQWTCDYGRAEDMRVLLENPHVDPNTGYQRPVEWAAASGNVDVLRVLLSCKRVCPKQNRYALETALREQMYDAVRMLLAVPDYERYGRHMNYNGDTRLWLFIQKEHANIALVVRWIGIEVGNGWKDLMCDVFVSYIGVLYEARTRRRRQRRRGRGY